MKKMENQSKKEWGQEIPDSCENPAMDLLAGSFYVLLFFLPYSWRFINFLDSSTNNLDRNPSRSRISEETKKRTMRDSRFLVFGYCTLLLPFDFSSTSKKSVNKIIQMTAIIEVTKEKRRRLKFFDLSILLIEWFYKNWISSKSNLNLIRQVRR